MLLSLDSSAGARGVKSCPCALEGRVRNGVAERWTKYSHRSLISVSWRSQLLASHCKNLVIITSLLTVLVSVRRSYEVVLVLLNPARGEQPINLRGDVLNLKVTQLQLGKSTA